VYNILRLLLSIVDDVIEIRLFLENETKRAEMHPGTYKKRSERNKIARPVSIYRDSCERNKR
jgi:hypothetical protein